MKVTRLEIAPAAGQADPRGARLVREAGAFLGIELRRARTVDVYHVEADLTDDEAQRILHEFVDPVLQRGALGRLQHDDFDHAVAVGYKPGVTDPVGRSAAVAVRDTLGRELEGDAAVYSSRLYLLDGVSSAQARRIAEQLVANPVIQTIDVRSRDEWLASPPDTSVPRVQSRALPEVETVDLDVSNEELQRISREGLLALSLEEMGAVRDHFLSLADDPIRRELGLRGAPTDVELECLAQTWSEHCKHKIFNATIRYIEPGSEPQTIHSLFGTYIRGASERIDADWLVSVFHDNAGVIAFDDHQHLVFKVETHNSPSALDPYGGAITGIVGVNRDPFGTGMGSDLLVNVWGYCFAPPDHAGPVPRGLMHPRRIRDGVHAGVIDGGNQSGIPYGRGWELFDERFLGKPLVFCGTVGALPVRVAGRPGQEKAARAGDLIVMTGGRIGADGIHGATFSSAALDETAPVQAVQIGDPITQKRMFDFLLEARDQGLYEAITDNGAGGLSSSVGEMARDPGGARLDLALAPLKYPGLAPWEILVSEAQERMTLAVSPDKIGRFLELAARLEVEATVLGEFTSSGELHVTYGDRTVALLSMAFLHDGDPEMRIEAHWRPPVHDEPAGDPPADLGQVLLDLLRRPNVGSNEAKARHYDHEVKALTVVKPLVGVRGDVPAEATVFLGRHDPGGGSMRGFVLSEGVNPFYSDIDTEAMAQVAVDLAVRRQLCAGARLDRIALLDNFCWPDPVESAGTPDGAYKLAQLVRACRGLHDSVVAYGAPLISGKDSMKNDAVMDGVKISVPPTLLVSAIGLIDDVREAVTLEPLAAGERIYLLGTTRDETGGSEYLRLRGERDGATAELGSPQPWVGNRVPRLRTAETLPLYRAFAGGVKAGLVRSAATPALAGWAGTFARVVLAGGLGLDLDLGRCPDLRALAADVALFSESAGRLMVTCREEDADRFESAMHRLPCHAVGQVVHEPRLRVVSNGATWIDLTAEALRSAFREPLDDE